MNSEDMALRVGQYVDLRDLLKQIDDAHNERRKEIVESMEQVSARLQTFLETNNLENLKTAKGTCYTATRYTASLADPGLFMDHVIQSKDWGLLDRRANATAVKEYVAEHNTLPPGCNLTSVKTLNVRRPTGK
jgi:hypothetical protein